DVGLWAADRDTEVALQLKQGQSVRSLRGSLIDALGSFGRPDVVHDSGIWLPHNHRLAVLAARSGIPRIRSTRGMLEPWARKHKALKKTVAWRFFQRRDLQRAAMLHATADQEALNLQQLGLDVPICVIPDGADLPVGDDERRKSRTNKGFRIALFV